MARATHPHVTTLSRNEGSGEFTANPAMRLDLARARYRLVVVADDPFEREGIATLALRDDSLRDGVVCAASWHEARARVIAAADDACVIVWPVGSAPAWELIREAAASDRATPLVVLARDDDEDAERAAIALGVSEWLVSASPEPEDLARLVRHAVVRSVELRALRARERRFCAAFESGDRLRLLIDASERCTEANDAARRAFGLDDSDLGSLDLASLVGPSARDALASRWESGDALPVYELSLRVQMTDDTPHEFEVSVAPRAVQGAHLVEMRDVTGREEVRQRVALSERMISLGTFASGVAHSINNPLQVLYSSIDIMQQSIDRARDASGDNLTSSLDAAAFELSSAREAAERVQRVVRDLAVFNGPESGRSSRLNLMAPLERAIRLAENTIRHKATLVREVRPVGSVMGNEAQLTQVFVHLLVNAAQSITHGSAAQNEVRVTLGRSTDGRLEVSVSDTGEGMSPEVLARVFDPFFTTRAVGEGAGLGLSVCHGAITAMGGEIVAESAPGRGSTFRVFLPALSATARPPRMTPLPAPDTMPSCRVLVIDDDAMVCRSLTRLLQAHHTVVAVFEAAEGLRRIEAGERFDVILCDVMMPEVSGVEFYERLRESVPEQAARVVFVTGGVFSNESRAFLDAGKHRVIEKPVAQGPLYKALFDVVRAQS